MDFVDLGGRTRIVLTMVMATVAQYEEPRAFGAVELGHETLRKLALFLGAA